MANKRIELEQYKCYVNLLEEDPNRKTSRRGLTILLVVSMLLVVLFLVLGMMSNNLAGIRNNVLEKPPAKAPADQVPGMDQIPGQQQIPMDQIPGQQQQLPEGVPPIPTAPSTSRAPAPDSMVSAALGAGNGALLAQEAPAASDQPVTPEFQQQVPAGSEGQPPAASDGAQKKPTGPPKETKGVGNLSNLARGAGGRGFQIYVLVLSIALLVIIYMAFSRARRERKTK